MAMTPKSSTAFTALLIVIAATLALSTLAPAQTASQLSPDEIKWLTFMREEEKLAHDVYVELYSKWKLRIFDNISRSEARHFASIGVLLARYEVEDPAKGLPAGVYKNPELTALHRELVEKGMLTLEAALEVGILIEKHDIADLEAALKDTGRTDIKTVYTNLLAGSLNHLDSFEQVHEAVCANQ
jgi:hypothetical protein